MVTSVAFMSPDGRFVASAPRRKAVTIWDLKGGPTKVELQEQGQALAFSPKRQFLAIGNDRGVITFYYPNKAEKYSRFSKVHKSEVTSLAVSPDGKTLASATLDGELKVWCEGEKPGEVIVRKHLPGKEPVDDAIKCVTFSKDGNRLAFSDVKGNVKVLDARANWDNIISFEASRVGVPSVAFSPDGNYLAAAISARRNIKVWDLNARELLWSLFGHTDFTSVAFSPDGERLASASLGGPINVWDLKTERVVLTLHGHRTTVSSVTFSSDGCLLASAGSDGTVRIWDATPLPPAPRGR
jgi:WD40 repeat protein